MPVDVTSFHSINMSDTCTVWNILSSEILCERAHEMKCVFSLTAYVQYECLFKPRKQASKDDETLKARLRTQQKNNRFSPYHLELADLMDVEILEKRKDLGKGELSSIAFAKRTRQAFMTDDQGARKLASQVLTSAMVQTTPHLLGWLCFVNRIGDDEMESIIEQHESVNRPLTKYFEDIHLKALEQRLAARFTST